MEKPTLFGKISRLVAIILLALTAAFNLMGGAGSSCIALAAENFGEKWAPLIPYKWLYQLLALVTLAAAIYGVIALIRLIKGRKGSYNQVILSLVLVCIPTIIQIAASRALRGASQPNDMRLYITLFTLIVLLILRIPALFQQIGFERAASGGTRSAAGGLAAINMGLLALSVQFWAGAAHTSGGVNYADAWHLQIALVGWLLIAGGMLLLGRAALSGLNEPGVDPLQGEKASLLA
jgi:hypothetical protein